MTRRIKSVYWKVKFGKRAKLYKTKEEAKLFVQKQPGGKLFRVTRYGVSRKKITLVKVQPETVKEVPATPPPKEESLLKKEPTVTQFTVQAEKPITRKSEPPGVIIIPKPGSFSKPPPKPAQEAPEVSKMRQVFEVFAKEEKKVIHTGITPTPPPPGMGHTIPASKRRTPGKFCVLDKRDDVIMEFDTENTSIRYADKNLYAYSVLNPNGDMIWPVKKKAK
jgi:hypothetical protein